MRLRNLVTVLALALPSVASADRAPTKTDREIQAFLTSKYTYCDAKVISGLWNASIGDAKATMGHKILAHNTAALDEGLQTARTNAIKNPSKPRCSFSEAGFSYDDAQQLAKLWKTDVTKAKAIAENKIIYGGEAIVRGMLKPAAPPPQSAEDKELDAFSNSKYNYCDAKLLAGLWKQSIWDSKLRIGRKIGWKNTAYLESQIADARKLALKTSTRCDWNEANFSYEDVERLGKLWKKSTYDAKMLVESKILTIGQDALRQMLASAPKK